MQKFYILLFGLMLPASIFGKQVNPEQVLTVAQETANLKTGLRSSNLQNESCRHNNYISE